MLINLMREHALADAEAGNWTAVASTLNALTQTVTVGCVGGKASLSALVAAGIDPNQVIAAMRSVPMASELLDTLTVSGVDWADDLTAHVMGGLVEDGKITQRTVALLRLLSVRDEAVVTTTADECQSAWLFQAKTDALDLVRNTASEAAADEYRKADSTPESIIAAAVYVLGAN